MGLLRSLAKKVLGRPESGTASVAPHPAAPPRGAAQQANSAAPPDHPRESVEAEKGATSTSKPWYLDGTNDGWDETDVKKDPSGAE